MEPISANLAPIQDLTTDSQSQSAAATPADETTVNKEMFLQLLVAQIRNQNPLNPTDGVQFLSQLAEFTSLEQQIGIHDDVAALRAIAEASQAQQSAAADTGAAGTSPVAGSQDSQ